MSGRSMGATLAALLLVAALGVPPAAAAGPQPDFEFPWRHGRTWYFTGGPHDWNAGSRSGIDYAPGAGDTRVLSVATGRITHQGPLPGDCSAGNVVKLDHGGGWQTWYLHLASIDTHLAKVGSRVPQGFPLGTVGGTKATGDCPPAPDWPVHIHLELMADGKHVTWSGRGIDGWTQYAKCGANAPAACREGNYKGWASKGDLKMVPKEKAGAKQAVVSSNRQSVNLGGLEHLGDFCRSIGYKEVGYVGNGVWGWRCIKKSGALVAMPWKRACEWHYPKRKNLFPMFRDKDHGATWRCYTGT